MIEASDFSFSASSTDSLDSTDLLSAVTGDCDTSFFVTTNTEYSLEAEIEDFQPSIDQEMLKKSFEDKNFRFSKYLADRPIEAYYVNRVRAYRIFLELEKKRRRLRQVVQS